MRRILRRLNSMPGTNVETTFGMSKGKLGERLGSETSVAQTNEILRKILCHNVCCLISSIYERGIEPDFYGEKEL